MLKHLKYFIRFSKTFGIFNASQMTFLVIGGVFTGLLELTGLSILFPLLNLILQPEIMHQNILVRGLTHFTGITATSKLTMMIGFLVAMVFILKNVVQVLYLKYEFKTITKWRVHIISRLYHLYMNSDYELFMRRNSSRMISLITSSVPVVLNSYIQRILTLTNLAITGVLILGYVIYINWMIAILIFTVAFFLTKGYGFLFKAKTTRLGGQAMELNAGQQAILQQSFAGYKETRSHLKELFFTKKFMATAQKLAKTEGNLFFIESLPPATVELVIMILIIIMFEVIVLTGSNLATASAQIGAIVISCMRMIPIINRTIGSINAVNASCIPVEDLLAEAERFNIEVGLFSKKQEINLTEEKDISSLPFEKEIALQNIDYTYPEAEKSTLGDISLSIKPGEFIGITGPSGSGKSTLIHILLGFFTSFKGQYTIDGTAITQGNIKSLRKIIGFVDQQIFVMDVSIAENIAYGVEKDLIDREKVIGALKKAQLWDYVSQLPEGIDTPVGENGKLLSGGQRQRLAIARAFYRDLKVLILDEASAALDVETEHKLFSFLETLKGELTLIIIAHRLSTLRDCDRILFFENGHIADSGTFEQLYNMNATFKNYIQYSQIEIENPN
jgi:ABC-type multidrug transport system fused ATPase/permease subunit